MLRDRFQRQSFLGRDSKLVLKSARVALIGVGGSGSHVVQQLAHVGIGTIVIFDADKAETSNLNRTIGTRRIHVLLRSRKVRISKRFARRISSKTKVIAYPLRWQRKAEVLRTCDIIISCVDSLQSRRELEVLARRFMIPLLDVGMTVSENGKKFSISGQFILSSPGDACMWCLGFLTDANLAEEANKYGAAGHNPQVVWPNGVLASTAVGFCVRILCPWCEDRDIHDSKYLNYDGDNGTLINNDLLPKLTYGCSHYRPNIMQEPRW